MIFKRAIILRYQILFTQEGYPNTYLLFKQLRLTGVGSEFTGGMWPGIVSISGYHCVTGFLGFSSIFSHCSRPMPIKSAPIAVQPINSFDPILWRSYHCRQMIVWFLIALLYLLPVVVDYLYYKTDVLDIIWWHIEQPHLVVHREQRVLLHWGLLLFYAFVLTQQVHLHVWICRQVCRVRYYLHDQCYCSSITTVRLSDNRVKWDTIEDEVWSVWILKRKF